MRIGITGGTGFVGRHLARSLAEDGHEVVLVARGVDRRDPSVLEVPGVRFAAVGTGDVGKLAEAFAGCEAVAHCAGINREIGSQTYARVHVEGTRNVVEACRRVGVRRIALLSFLRARPDCGSGYHESKWEAEEIVRGSGVRYTVLKAGVIYGQGDHMLDHLSRALHTFPVFGLVGFRERPIRPTAVQDMVRILRAALAEGKLENRTVAVLGPERLDLGEAVRRVASVVGKSPLYVRLPILLHRVLAWGFERTMVVPLLSSAQLRILSEGIAEPLPGMDALPDDWVPGMRFAEERIRAGLPEPEPFGMRDCLCLSDAAYV